MILAPVQLESDFLSLLSHFEPDNKPPECPPALALARQGVPLALRGLSKSYAARSVLKDVVLDLAAGEFVAVVGRSGCGKSTLLRAIAQLERADSGSIVIGSGHMKPDVRIMFQEARLLPWKTVLENVALGLPHAPGAAAAALWTVGLAERADDWPAALSGGQRQRVALARALVHEPQLLLLDEPLGALDLKLREHMKVELKQLQAAFGTTFVYITHDQSEALVLSDQVAVMNAGRFEQVGTPQQLYYEPQTPFVAGFVGANNRFAGRITQLNLQEGLVAVASDAGLNLRARSLGQVTAGQAVEVFIRPEAISLARHAAELPQDQSGHVRCAGQVESLLFDGANSAVLLREAASRTEFRIALPQTGRFADLRVGETVAFGFDPVHAVCFACASPHGS